LLQTEEEAWWPGIPEIAALVSGWCLEWEKSGSEENTEEEDMILQVVKGGYERGEYWFGGDVDGRNLQAEKDLVMVGSPIISASVLVVLSSKSHDSTSAKTLFFPAV
jgi:hypothetical protein